MPHAPIAEQRKEWGALLRQAREQRELTQAALAQLSGLDQASVSRVEAGQGGLHATFQLAKTLGVTLEVAA